jgi:hypothetical protein
MPLDFEGVDNIFKTGLLSSEESFWSGGAVQFVGNSTDDNNYTYVAEAGMGAWVQVIRNNIKLHCVPSLPQGAIITDMIVYGSASDEQYLLLQAPLNSQNNAITLATGSFNAVSKLKALVDNSQYYYIITTSALDTNDQIYGAVINYTRGQLKPTEIL